MNLLKYLGATLLWVAWAWVSFYWPTNIFFSALVGCILSFKVIYDIEVIKEERQQIIKNKK